MPLPYVLQMIISWLRTGYPDGVPAADYIPLFALLGSQLTEVEVLAIADELANSSDPDSAAAIKRAINEVTHEKPTDADVNRVRAHLAEGGWPLAPVEPSAAERAAGAS
jgi:Protein of unknown function (DUF3349)